MVVDHSLGHIVDKSFGIVVAFEMKGAGQKLEVGMEVGCERPGVMADQVGSHSKQPEVSEVSSPIHVPRKGRSIMW